MTPYETALQIYAQEQRSLTEEIDIYGRMDEGRVHLSPEFILIGCRIGDGWYIRLACGNGYLRQFVSLMPYRLPWIGWHRVGRGRNDIKWYDTERLLRHVTYEKKLNILPYFVQNVRILEEARVPTGIRSSGGTSWGSESSETSGASISG